MGNRKAEIGVRDRGGTMSPLLPTLVLAALAPILLGGCTLLASKDPPTIYAPTPRVQAGSAWPRTGWQLAISTSAAAAMIDSPRIAVRPTPNELQVYKDASWARRPTDMLEDALIRALEDSGAVRSVSRPGSGITTDHRLLLDLRRFESDYAGAATPTATIEVNAKLLRAGQAQVTASRTFLVTVPASDTAVPAVVDAFERALAQAAAEIGGWALAADAGVPATPGH